MTENSLINILNHNETIENKYVNQYFTLMIENITQPYIE